MPSYTLHLVVLLLSTIAAYSAVVSTTEPFGFTTLWKQHFPGKLKKESVTFLNSTFMLVADEAHTLTLIDAAQRTVLWTMNIANDSGIVLEDDATPQLINGGQDFCYMTFGHIKARNLRNGSLVWSKPYGYSSMFRLNVNGITSSLILHRGISGGGATPPLPNSLTLLDSTTGHFEWNHNIGTSTFSGPFGAHDVMIGQNNTNPASPMGIPTNLFAFVLPKFGDVLWSLEAPGDAVAFAPEHNIFAHIIQEDTVSADIHVREMATGKELWSIFVLCDAVNGCPDVQYSGNNVLDIGGRHYNFTTGVYLGEYLVPGIVDDYVFCGEGAINAGGSLFALGCYNDTNCPHDCKLDIVEWSRWTFHITSRFSLPYSWVLAQSGELMPFILVGDKLVIRNWDHDTLSAFSPAGDEVGYLPIGESIKHLETMPHNSSEFFFHHKHTLFFVKV